jgi:hypothetical protein
MSESEIITYKLRPKKTVIAINKTKGIPTA